MKPRDPLDVLTLDDLRDWWQALDNDEQEQAHVQELLRESEKSDNQPMAE